MERKEHWENVFSTKTEKEVSWYQESPKTSLNYFHKLNIPKDAKIIDIGGGDSYLIDALLDLGYTNLTLLDISAGAIERIKKRLGDKATQVTFIVSDVLDFKPDTTYDFWHDRASFHFLTEPIQIAEYAAIVASAVAKNGNLVIGTFSVNGPMKCSGLDITQYDEAKLKAVFEKDFDLIESFTEDHKTPFNTTQNFIFCNFKKK
ncbi:class I SAM-dependent methyltransferase [Flavobacterium sp. AS60]|uniref:class I SAM-dependent methyltransferase n=1 Tax=Flavobacterium anseongense TaxID=2910677 RepID=UPI001F309FAD|nr:class I SAM-dependent methyltransferase [Flavobacterium sp. AS60]MCF6130153.1 class I SAM-dependent methyltransferase [Flavobacterium sp. AS60]